MRRRVIGASSNTGLPKRLRLALSDLGWTIYALVLLPVLVIASP